MVNATKTRNNAPKLLYVSISLLISAGILWYLFRFVSITEILEIIKNADRTGLLLFFCLSALMSVMRTWRYQVILRVSGHAPGGIAMFLVVLVRNFFSDLLPARLGTLIYIFIVQSRLGIPFGAAASSFGLAFLFDVLALAPLVILASFLMSAPALSSTAMSIAAVAFGLITIAIIATLPALCVVALRVNAHLPFPQRLSERLNTLIAAVREDLLRAARAGIYSRLIVISILVRVAKYLGFYVLLCALLAPLGFAPENLPLPGVFFGLLAPEISASLPISGIAGFGVYEGTWTFMFKLLGFSTELASLTAISHHLFTQVYGYSIGLAALLLLLLPVWKTSSTTAATSTVDSEAAPLELESRPAFWLRIAGSICCVGLVYMGSILFIQARSQMAQAENIEIAAGKSERKAARAFLASIPGRVVFDSNRSGSFGIYVLTRQGATRKLVDTEAHEMFPDPHPLGTHIVYGRSDFVVRTAPSDIWIIEADGSNPRLLVKNGQFPTFSSEGNTVYFERQRKSLHVINIDGSGERLVFPAKKSPFKRYAVVKPRVSPDGKWVAFTSDRKGRWNAWIANLESGRGKHIRHGCEPTWFGDSRTLGWIKKTGSKSGSGIVAFDRESGEISSLHDAGKPFGHEYFPSIVLNDSYLLHAACPPDQHSHETDNYQLFARDLKGKDLFRLTFDGYTNRWPKLLAEQSG